MSKKKTNRKVLVSACLLGQRVRYDGGHSAARDAVLADWRLEDRIVAFCPEVSGGLATPRPPAEIIDGTGADVLDGRARVATEQGQDVTEAFLRGAQNALRAAMDADVALAVLKSKSPSCGSKFIYDGSFSGTKRAGQGVTTALLERHGIRVFAEHELAEADAYLRRRGGDD